MHLNIIRFCVTKNTILFIVTLCGIYQINFHQTKCWQFVWQYFIFNYSRMLCKMHTPPPPPHSYSKMSTNAFLLIHAFVKINAKNIFSTCGFSSMLVCCIWVFAKFVRVYNTTTTYHTQMRMFVLVKELLQRQWIALISFLNFSIRCIYSKSLKLISLIDNYTKKL